MQCWQYCVIRLTTWDTTVDYRMLIVYTQPPVVIQPNYGYNKRHPDRMTLVHQHALCVTEQEMLRPEALKNRVGR